MWLFVFIYVSADSWAGFARKNEQKRLFFIAIMKHWKCSGNIAATLYSPEFVFNYHDQIFTTSVVEPEPEP
jgi:hypothetical protein